MFYVHYKTLKDDLFFRDIRLQVSVPSTLLGETSPLSFPHINGLLKLGKAGEILFSILISPLVIGTVLQDGWFISCWQAAGSK